MAVATLIGLGFVWFFLPETAGKSLESMDEMFSLPWHVIGRKGAELTKGKGRVSEAMGSVENGKEKEKGDDVEAAATEVQDNSAAERK